MFSINVLCFMSNFSFKGDTLYWLIPSGGIDLSLCGDKISWDTGRILVGRVMHAGKITLASGLSSSFQHEYNKKIPMSTMLNSIIVIVISKFLKRHSKAKRTRAPAYSRALRRIKGGFQRGGSREAQVRLSFYTKSIIMSKSF